MNAAPRPLVRPSFWEDFFPSDPGGWLVVKLLSFVIAMEVAVLVSILLRRFL